VDHDLKTVFAFFQSHGGAATVVAAALVKTGASDGSHTAVLDDAVNHSLCFISSCSRTTDLAFSVLVALLTGDKLDPTVALRFDPSKILPLATNDKADEAGLDRNGLAVVVVSS
jgi:hypothetical protein